MNNPPAFPTTHKTCSDAERLNCEHCGSDGMTLRDYFAAAAITLFERRMDCSTYDFAISASEGAYIIADAMLAAREATSQSPESKDRTS